MNEPGTIYIDASLLTDGTLDARSLAAELGLRTVVVDEDHPLPDDLRGGWHLTDDQPEPGARHWSRTVVIGPRSEAGRRAVVGLRTARDLRLALLELASEHAMD